METIHSPETISRPTKMVAGELTLSGGAGIGAVSVVGKLSKVVAVSLTLKNAVAPALKDQRLTYGVETATPLQVDVYSWSPAGVGDPTLIASSDATQVVSYMIAGY